MRQNLWVPRSVMDCVGNSGCRRRIDFTLRDVPLTWVHIDWEKRSTCKRCGLKKCMCCGGCKRNVKDCSCEQKRPPSWLIQEAIETVFLWGRLAGADEMRREEAASRTMPEAKRDVVTHREGNRGD